ncbi:MAG TPA: DUF2007 domain-containing protein [Aggregatilinea sp.]|uniref:putative signal transducing protein n=1 Tax=Aggregatilinea sp. TaxID=2806333 RepID=UPI002BC5B20E|nr:DUF2007 domain-containing protein [Aggregatilinea sp.]HML24071.1 DUF2007 domain-containing protein [Aggregatilinea sp.]
MSDDDKALIRRGPDQRPWYIVAHATSMVQAEIPAGLLRSAGIPVFLFREAASTAIPVSFGLLGNIDIAVPEDYYADAMALLEEGDVEPDDELLPGDDVE